MFVPLRVFRHTRHFGWKIVWPLRKIPNCNYGEKVPNYKMQLAVNLDCRKCSSNDASCDYSISDRNHTPCHLATALPSHLATLYTVHLGTLSWRWRVLPSRYLREICVMTTPQTLRIFHVARLGENLLAATFTIYPESPLPTPLSLLAALARCSSGHFSCCCDV